MADLHVHSDIESSLIVWLPSELETRLGFPVDVGDSLMENDSMAVYRTGGVEAWVMVDVPTITFEVKAESPGRAVRILNMARALVADLPRSGEPIPEANEDGTLTGGDVWVVGYEEFAGPGNLPRPGDPYRYTMLVSLSVGAQIL